MTHVFIAKAVREEACMSRAFKKLDVQTYGEDTIQYVSHDPAHFMTSNSGAAVEECAFTDLWTLSVSTMIFEDKWTEGETAGGVAWSGLYAF